MPIIIITDLIITVLNIPVLIITDAIWTRNATLALFALYEAKLYMLDNPKTRGKIWQEISTALLEYDIQVSYFHNCLECI